MPLAVLAFWWQRYRLHRFSCLESRSFASPNGVSMSEHSSDPFLCLFICTLYGNFRDCKCCGEGRWRRVVLIVARSVGQCTSKPGRPTKGSKDKVGKYVECFSFSLVANEQFADLFHSQFCMMLAFILPYVLESCRRFS